MGQTFWYYCNTFMEPAPTQASSLNTKLIPVLMILLIVAAFFIGSLYTRVSILEKKPVAVENTGQVAGAAANNNQPAVAAADNGPALDVNVSGTPFLGKTSAQVAVVEFTDFQCPFCGQQFRDTFPKIRSDYIDTGKIRYYVKDFPLFQIHPFAQKAAEAGSCANEQNKYFEMHDVMFKNQQALSVADLKKTAASLGLNTSQFDSCLDSGKYAGQIAASEKLGESLGVRGTPTSFVGTIKSDVVHGVTISGAVPFETFKAAIDKSL
jgi:protein-disulfide isomerase